MSVFYNYYVFLDQYNSCINVYVHFTAVDTYSCDHFNCLRDY